MIRKLPLLAVLLLAGCGQNVAGVQTMPVPKTPDQALYEAEVSFDIALRQATLYASQPRCGTVGASAVCSKAAVAATLYQDAVRGQEALGVARTAVGVYRQIAAPAASDTDKAMAAVNGLVSITAQVIADLPKKTGG